MNNQTRFTIQDFEEKARELMTIAYALTEQRYKAAFRRQTLAGRIKQEAVVCLQAAINTFLHIARLPH